MVPKPRSSIILVKALKGARYGTDYWAIPQIEILHAPIWHVKGMKELVDAAYEK
jgi:hypothetical protein